MRLGQLTILACSLLLASSATWAAPATTSGSVALALAGVVAPYSPLPAKEKKAVAAFLGGDSNVPITRKITVTADKVVCRASNVDITSRSCELSFGSKTHTVRGSEANAMFATVALAGVPPDGAAGTIYEALSKLSCTLDPKVIKDKAGGGADCSFEPGN
ncbi:hypothetical protein ACVIIZ_005713 [Bradyrhizobium sp. USDA 4523]|uniref:hypothetical protein n=1 Tax=unclassified Bradyrhizobium TaxID=2631580 RepID=UPI0020A161BB|nr:MULTISPECIES: hypothetical protein [unclassified Bradyrhizobium]MCP1839418.1 hypothetical protein [Bradyrhizobium sp. USDA 4538]MCP1899982.1 hypothetical protein [Bradyrhizobium sp. USDA 4537]MCP1985909.1 hypothetical protein [Bradyrhizobium sp. USDA 4539]